MHPALPQAVAGDLAGLEGGDLVAAEKDETEVLLEEDSGRQGQVAEPGRVAEEVNVEADKVQPKELGGERDA